MTKHVIAALLVVSFSHSLALAVSAPDAEHEKQADAVIAKAIAFLRSKQEADGSWNPKSGPGVTAMIISALLDQPGIDKDDAALNKAIKYVLSTARFTMASSKTTTRPSACRCSRNWAGARR
jgi:hypothetical protein